MILVEDMTFEGISGPDQTEQDVPFFSGSTLNEAGFVQRWLAPKPEANPDISNFSGSLRLTLDEVHATALGSTSQFTLLVEDDLAQATSMLFARPERDWSPEARIVRRFNENRRRIAELQAGRHRDLSMTQVREHIVSTKGETSWQRLVQREAERQAAELWSDE